MINEGATVFIPDLQNRKLVSRGKPIQGRVPGNVCQGWDLKPDRKAPECASRADLLSAFRMLSKPAIMPFCVLFFSLDVIVEWFLPYKTKYSSQTEF